MEMIDVANFRKDFFRIKRRPNIISKFQYMLPQSIRWISENIISLLFNTHSYLKMDTEHLIKVVLENVGPHTFQEAFDRTGRIINITVAPTNAFEPPRLLNYLTAPHICVWSATVASCAIPGVFDSVSLIVKEPDGEYRPESEWGRHSAVGRRLATTVTQGFTGKVFMYCI
jgi:predicted acylesterase/phospholipase RssA